MVPGFGSVIGTVVGDRFAIDRLAGRGGMGAVYHAIDRRTGEQVAVKVLHDTTAPDSIERFLRECRLLAELAHPAVVRFLDSGVIPTDGDAAPYLAMEWLEGEDLATRLRREGIGATAAVELIARVAAGLGTAHARGVIHRDIKPSNLFLVGGDLARVKLLDFGIARIAAAAGAHDSDMTRTGAAIGTPRYMAPEQARGSRNLDARADVFSLGCVLYECLAGRPPFSGDTPMAVLAKILLEDAPLLADDRPDLPAAAHAVVARMLAKEPAGRPRDGAEVAQVLAELGAVGDAAREPMSARDSAITIGEQRLVCVVFAQAAVAGTGDPSTTNLTTDTIVDAHALGSSPPPPRAASDEHVGRARGSSPPAPRAVSDEHALGSRPVSDDRAALVGRARTDVAASDDDGALVGRARTDAGSGDDGAVVGRARTDVAGSDDDGTLSAEAPAAVVPALSAVVARHGGRAEVLADGSVVVTLLGQGAATDQAARAARCALAVRDIVPRAAMAMAMGRAIVAERTPFGELIDRAAALLAARAPEPSAQVGTPIRVDEISAGLLDVRFEIAGDARGLYLAGERDVAGPARTLLGKPTPCVGRERELAMLTAIFDECVAEPMAHAVVVTAAAGVGKSRLRHELLQRLAPRGAEIWIGRGNPLSAGAPFAMLAQALRRVAGIVESEPLHVRHLKLRARVTRNLAVDQQVAVSEFLGELVGAPLADGGSMQLRAARGDPQLMGDQMLRACEDFVTAECAAHPVVLVLEDLQWSDVATVRFVDALLRQLADRPFFVLALARPEVDATFPRLWAERGVERIALGELTRRAAEKLVREALGTGATDAVIARLVERAAGNAFYLEELVRSVADGKGDALPETVIAMVAARIEGLEPAARHVLRAASIYGQVFWRSGLAALLDGGATHVHDWLDELVRRELVTARRDSRFLGEPEFGFRHALVREAAYAMLTPKDRTSGHRSAGRWLEAKITGAGGASGADAVILAEHFERGGEPARAAGWWRRAAELALEGDDLAAVIERADRAIACLGGDAEGGPSAQLAGALRQLQSGAHVWRGEYVAAAERGAQACARLPAGGEAWLHAMASRADALTRLLEHERVVELCAQLVDTPTTSATHRVYCQAVALTLTTLLWHASAGLAARLFARLDAIEGEVVGTDPAALAWILHARSWRATAEGDASACLMLDTRVVACFTEVGDLRHACQQRANVGYDENMLGAFARAEVSLCEAIAIATRMGAHHVSAQAKHNLGFALVRLGRIDEARAVESEAHDLFIAQGNRRLRAAASHYLAVIEACAGDFAAAIRWSETAFAEAKDWPAGHAQILATLSETHLRAGRADEALACARRATAAMAEHGRPEEGEIATMLAYAEALAATGDRAAAITAVGAAAARLAETAAKITDLGWRASFLDAIPENRRVRLLAEELLP